MRIGLLICLLAALVAAQFEYYVISPLTYFPDTVYIGQAQFSELVWNYGIIEEVVNGQWIPTTFHGVNPGMATSQWLPNGTGIEYTYTRATALFNITQVDPRRDVKWYLYSIHYPNVWETKPVAIVYGLFATVKSGSGPMLNVSCLKPWANSLYWYRCPSPPRTKLSYVVASYAVAYSNVYIYTFVQEGAKPYRTMTGRRYVVNGTIANNTVVDIFGIPNNVTARDLGTRFFCVGFNSVSPIHFSNVPAKCISMPTPPRNVTVSMRRHNATASAVDVYVDGELFYTFYVDDPNAVLYTGPYAKPFMATTGAFIMLNYPGMPLKPLGSALLLIGNDTVMAPPRYVLKAMEPGYAFITVPINNLYAVPVNLGIDETWAEPVLTWSGVYVRPGSMGNNATVYQWPTVPVKIHGRTTELPYRAMVNVSKLCPGGAVVSGQYRWVGGWVEVRGPASIHCTKYPITFTTLTGNTTVIADFNTTLMWQPPPIVYPNGTRLEAEPVKVFVDGPKTVRVNYTHVYYLVRVSGFNGTWELWVPRGGELELPPAVLDNGTRLVVREMEINGRPAAARIKVEEPLNVTLRYGRQYLVKLIAPVNSTEAWVDEGSVFKVGLADPWEPGNGTLFKTLLVNGTSAREFRVDKPMTLVAQYAEVYYWAVVETPVNKTAGWIAKDTVLKFPDTVNFGNGTRLAEPSVREVVVDRPVKVVVTYAKRQHYVKIEGVNRWEGWVEAGAVVRLNTTVVGGVEYTPAEVVTASNPGVYKPLFYAVYRTVARDVLGVPNPLATVRLCNATASPLPDGSAVVTAYTRELCQPTVEAFPISPYTAAGAAAVATTAALALRKRKK